MTGNKPVVEKRFEYHAHPCVVIFQTIGHRCGYVGLPKDNKYYGVNYNEIDIDCHGGLTYSSSNLYEQNDTDIWWIGFDCAHCDDAKDYDSLRKYYTDERSKTMIDRWEALDRKYPDGSKVRDLDYVVNECKNIVEQIEKKYWEDYIPPEEDQETEPPMIFGNILIPMEDWKMTKEALKEELMCDDSQAYGILNRIFEIALERAEDDKT